MEYVEFIKVSENFGEKRFIEDGYYQFKLNGYGQYEMSFLVDGPCSTTVPHPQITLHVVDKEVKPLRLLDLETNPARIWNNKEHQVEIEEELTKLVAKFLGKI